jgi:hypothetical protein
LDRAQNKQSYETEQIFIVLKFVLFVWNLDMDNFPVKEATNGNGTN